MASQPSKPPESNYNPVDQRAAWSPGFFARLPWLGFGALLGSILGIAASIGVLIASNGQPISDWTFQPTVYLSIASTLTNIMLHFALVEGIKVAWWRRAMKDQTSLSDLQHTWAYGNSLWYASTSGRHFNLVALACIIATLAPVNGPLLQRASTVTTQSQVSDQSVRMLLAPQIPLGFSGYVSGREEVVSLFTANFTPTVLSYNNRDTIKVQNTDCKGVCSAKVIGAGFAVNCSSYLFPFDLRPSTAHAPNGDYIPGQATINGTQAFLSSFGWYGGTAGNISLDVQYKNSSACFGNLVVQNCSLRSATVQYPVIINSDASSITLDPNSTIFDDVVGDIQELGVENRPGLTTIGGLWLALSNRFDSLSHLRWVGADGYELLGTGSTANTYALITESPSDNYGGFDPGSTCSLHFSDPVPQLLQSARELMFRTALAAANSSDVRYVSAQQSSTRPTYASKYVYLAVASAVSVFAVSCISLTFHGYWRLGRKVSMSPIETAKAFNPVLLRSRDSNANSKALLGEVGNQLVKYGAVESTHSNSSTSEYSRVDSVPARRLEMADPNSVLAPEEGWRFEG